MKTLANQRSLGKEHPLVKDLAEVSAKKLIWKVTVAIQKIETSSQRCTTVHYVTIKLPEHQISTSINGSSTET